jgi:zinc protease
MSTRPDRTSAPPPGARVRWSAPKIDRIALPQAELIIVPTPGRGLFQLELALPVSALAEPGGCEGVTSLLAMSLDRGTSHHDARSLAARAEELGGAIGTSQSWETVSVEVGGLASHFEPLVELLTEIAADPVFPEAEVATARARRLADFARRRASAGALADAALTRLLRLPSRDALAVAGRPDSVAACGREQLIDLWSRSHRLRPLLIAAGDVDPHRVAAHVATLGAPAGVPVPTSPPKRPTAQRRVVLVDRPDAAQTEIRIGQAGLGRLDHRRAELMLLEGVLGGSFGSRLNLELRERLALTYGVRTTARSGRFDGTLETAAAVHTDRAGLAVARSLEILAALRERGPTADEVAVVRQYRLDSVPYSYQSLSTVAGRAFDIGLYELPTDDLDTTLERLAHVSTPEVAALAGTLLDPDRAVIVAVGPAHELESQLRPFGTVERWTAAVLEGPIEGE